MRLAAIALVTACSQASPAPAPTAMPVEKSSVVEPTLAETNALAMQIDQGRQLFAEHCASCHGDSGQGTDDGPTLVGKTALSIEPVAGAKRDVQFHTAADVLGFAMRNMPADDPASLQPEQYEAVVAFALAANGVRLERPLDADTTQSIVLHP